MLYDNSTVRLDWTIQGKTPDGSAHSRQRHRAEASDLAQNDQDDEREGEFMELQGRHASWAKVVSISAVLFGK